MATEEGIVIKLGAQGAGTAWVKTTRSSACESCTSKHDCHSTGGGREMEVEAINTADARVDDRVVLQLKTASLLKATFLLYVFPILAMIGGALVGQTLAGQRGYDPSATSALFGFLFFGLAFVVIRLISRWMSADTSYKPEIIKVRRHQAPSLDASAVPGTDA